MSAINDIPGINIIPDEELHKCIADVDDNGHLYLCLVWVSVLVCLRSTIE
jgi:hypothetical protein